jgi:hypothetical protein
MPAMRFLARDSESERWLSVLLRSLHLAGVVWLGAAVLGAPAGHRGAALLVLASGTLMLFMDLRAGRLAVREVAGAAVLLKLALVAWMALDARHAVVIFWVLVLGSAVTSHAPKGFRHWPTPARAKAQAVSRLPTPGGSAGGPL